MVRQVQAQAVQQHRPVLVWLGRATEGKYRQIQLPPGLDRQFTAFRDICLRIKRLADAAGRATVEAERQGHGVTPPKAVDNAIMNFIRLHGVTIDGENSVEPAVATAQ